MKAEKAPVKVGVWASIINDKNELLLLRKKDFKIWDAPGGKVEDGESLETAVKREVLEEVGVEIEFTMHYFLEEVTENGYHWFAFYFPSRIANSGIPKIMEPEKHAELKWFPLSALPETHESIKQVLKKYFNSIKEHKSEKN